MGFQPSTVGIGVLITETAAIRPPEKCCPEEETVDQTWFDNCVTRLLLQSQTLEVWKDCGKEKVF